MKFIEYTNPHRKKHFEFFQNMDQPHFNVCANVDITLFRKFVKTNELPFNISMVYLASKAANAIPAFRQRIREGKVVEHESVHPSFTVLIKETDVFSFCYVDYREGYQNFIAAAQQQMERMKTEPTVEDEPGRDDFLFLTSFPWASFTSVSHPMHYHPVDSVPRITWGKFFEENGRIKMPLSVQAHHATVDGHHAGQYFELIQKLLDLPMK